MHSTDYQRPSQAAEGHSERADHQEGSEGRRDRVGDRDNHGYQGWLAEAREQRGPRRDQRHLVHRFVVDYGLVDLPVFDDYGYPIQERGVVGSHPGLYLMGVPFQTSLSSVLIGGVGRDAEHIAEHIKNKRAEDRASDPVH